MFNFFRIKKTCEHDKIPLDVEYAYCPDCGELVENQWYMVRCACCGVKLRGIIKNGKIIPEKHYCHNCGSNEFIVEKIDKINFIDIRFAVLRREVVISNIDECTQSWVDSVGVYYGKKYIQCKY